MSYTPTEWKKGDVVTSEKLNKLEQGVAAGGSGGVLVVNIDDEYTTLDKTWIEIHDALAQGKLCITLYEEDGSIYQCPIVTAEVGGPPGSQVYSVFSLRAVTTTPIAEQWNVLSEDGYPVLTD